VSIPNKYAPAVNVQPPRCPHCSTELPEISTFQWTRQISTGLCLILSAYCLNAECRKLLATQLFIVAGAVEESSIVRPPS
jgi:hypothetical protein